MVAATDLSAQAVQNRRPITLSFGNATSGDFKSRVFGIEPDADEDATGAAERRPLLQVDAKGYAASYRLPVRLLSYHGLIEKRLSASTC
jgi:hypothetical protein